ncbi:acyltransferase [Rhodoblastus sp.]|uniref:acyltransferase family protein n=1 Tax=Rhodoblastus sp. TaxID=1962975 RepID=UPI0025CEF256|nr:acyltransferase [Rhodoblastus sp.]
MSINSRVVGLDIIRTCAILFVIFGHFSQHSLPPQWFGTFFGPMGIFGVELFFALSGYLIGGIIIRQFDAGKFYSFMNLSNFWFRRWMRTLPLYYFFLLVYFQMDWRGPFAYSKYWQYFLFGQNLSSVTPPFFELSWSLAIEEWFYLIFPFTLIIAAKFIAGRRAVAAAMIVLVMTPLALRLTTPLFNQTNDMLGFIRVPVMFRLDAITYGVLMASVRAWRPEIWKLLQRHAWAFFVAYALLLVYFWIKTPGLEQHVTRISALFAAIPFISALLIPYMSTISLNKQPTAQTFFVYTSIVSYSIYLGHILVIILINKYIFSFRDGKVAIYDNWYYLYPLYITGTYAMAFMTYILVERPFLKLRDMWSTRKIVTLDAV